ncbi:hypothetical protein [Rhodopila sp.]|uniref:hypothetical protein n=1 Tax=Rhodopila sp. TaxID=2480087 RepID=UPI002CAB3FFA|nr:hypothetical protein [Rhodopila sp.]HVZ06952.1 hypothetical protein [Rhodopila sp.]
MLRRSSDCFSACFSGAAIVAAGMLAVAVPARAQTVIVAPPQTVAPPPPRVEVPPPPPSGPVGMAWQPGHWRYTGDAAAAWAWQPGQYVPIPQGYRSWVPGQWVRSETGGYVWQDGHWG